MKKRISLILALFLAIGSLSTLVACDKDDSKIPQDVVTTEDIGKLPQDTTTTENNTVSEGSNNNGQGDETEAPVVQSKDWVLDDVFDASSFQDGIAFVRYRVKNQKTGTLELRISAINTAGTILWELPIGANDSFPEIMNGTLMINQKTVYDTNGKQIASPESHGYDSIVIRTETQFLVSKQQSSFSGNTEYFGVFDNKGNWIIPLTSDLTLGGVTWSKCALMSDNALVLYDNSYNLLGVYHIDTQTITPYYQEIFAVKQYSSQPAGVYKRDENGNETMLLADYAITKTIQLNGSYTNLIYICCKEENGVNHYIALDSNGNTIADYGTKYNLHMYDYYNGHLLCAVNNAAGDLYYTIITPQGELAFEPFQYENYMHLEPYLYAEGFITYILPVYTLHDFEGNTTILPETTNGRQTGKVYPFSCGLAYTDSKCFINPKGEIVIDLYNLVIPE